MLIKKAVLGDRAALHTLDLWPTLDGLWVLYRLARRTGTDFPLSVFFQAKKAGAKLARLTPATWHQTPRSSITSGSSYRSWTPPSTAWVRSTTSPPWPEPGPVKRRTSWPPGTRLHLLPSYILCTKSAPGRSSVSIGPACAGISERFSVFCKSFAEKKNKWIEENPAGLSVVRYVQSIALSRGFQNMWCISVVDLRVLLLEDVEGEEYAEKNI